MTINHAAEETTSVIAPHTNSAAPKWFGALGLLAALGAVVASSCCVIPLGLAAVGAGASVLGGLEIVAGWRVPFVAVSALAIVVGWGAWWKRPAPCVSDSACASLQRSRATLGLLLCASFIVMLAAGWGYIDPVLLKMFRGR